MLAVDIATVIPLTVPVVQREATIACYIDPKRLIQPRRCIPHRFTTQSADLMLPSLLDQASAGVWTNCMASSTPSNMSKSTIFAFRLGHQHPRFMGSSSFR